jgi:oxygen-independent coproporphyrinogen III oxidase
MAGIYIHIPFCKQQCSYCDFHFSTTFEVYRSEMIDTICAEIATRSHELKAQTIDTIYLGGGTPSLLTEKEFSQLFATLNQHFDIAEHAEITLEANPDDSVAEALRTWRRIGINRLSIGLQSFRESDLRWMNRAHNAEEAKNCVQLAKKEGFDSISIDLMYGLPNLDLTTWKEHIVTAINFGVDHISSYCLTVEEKTLLHKKVKDGEIKPSSEDEQAQQFDVLRAELAKSDFHQYEVSNFCRPGKEAKHNSSYWKGAAYLGVGPSAHSFDGKSRRFNVANNKQYIKRIKEGSVYFEREILTVTNQFNELLLTGLRTIWGVDLFQLSQLIPLSEVFLAKVRDFEVKKMLIEKNGKLFLIGEGWLMADHIVSELFEG